jgi:hypothetical protein
MKLDDNVDILDLIIASISFILGVIAPTISVMVGAVLYYSYLHALQNIKINPINIFFVLITAFFIGLYFIPLIDLFVIQQGFDNSKITPALGFILGIFGKPLLTYIVINAVEIVNAHLDAFLKR